MGCGCGHEEKAKADKTPRFKTLATDNVIATVIATSNSILETPTGSYNMRSGGSQRFSRASALALISSGAPIWVA